MLNQTVQLLKQQFWREFINICKTVNNCEKWKEIIVGKLITRDRLPPLFIYRDNTISNFIWL